MRFVGFFVVSSLLLGSVFYYIGRRLIRPMKGGPALKRLAWALVGVFFLIPLISFSLFMNRHENGFLDTVGWVGYVILGLLSLVATFMVLRDILLGVGRLGSWFRWAVNTHEMPPDDEEKQVNLERRKFLLRSTNLAILTGAGTASAFGFYEARHRSEIREVKVPLAKLPPEFEGFRIVQFSDLHVGPTIKRPFVEEVVSQIKELRADCIVFTGDLVDGSVQWLRNDVAPLQELSAPWGKFFVTGNHEYYSEAEPWVEEARRLGFTVLMNEHRVLERNGGRLVMAGVTDYTAGQFVPSHQSRPDLAALNAPSDVSRVLLAHQPVSAHAAVKAGFDLQLSGHTHGGQFFPWNYMAYFNQPFIKGLHRMENMWVYVNSGIGYWGPPLRLGAPPEITHFTLTRGV